ncbi:hypothetical protein Ctob_006315 [Chrysochromulina tobinii]|uniref:Uncharacterized protein n=1 Tax=Chrysochromulina tobinii TaxID=1460289 RepID=A0A0M0JKU5_9EUKA|nr:hypothetical protein Ctob_006315 [Chrysochromulina tobinii]|eukprot:KOO27211.1 hypothetical protein Ctob_006315 [Chrysochromulina sp. CCMP291]
MGKVGVSVLLCFASAWTCAMRLPCASSSQTASRSQPRALTQGCRNTGVAAAILKSDDLCVGVGVSENNAFGLGVVNDPSSLRLCASPDRCAVDVQFLGDAANTDAAANQMTFKRRIASTTRYTGFSSCISTQSRARSMSMLTTGQEPEAGVQGDIIACVKKIGECEAEIAKCEEKINDVDTELMKEGISADNLAFWREEKKQLRKEKEQLRKEKEQLRKEKEQLRDNEKQYLKERELLLTKSLANGGA